MLPSGLGECWKLNGMPAFCRSATRVGSSSGAKTVMNGTVCALVFGCTVLFDCLFCMSPVMVLSPIVASTISPAASFCLN